MLLAILSLSFLIRTMFLERELRVIRTKQQRTTPADIDEYQELIAVLRKEQSRDLFGIIMANLSDYDVADVLNSDENSYRGDIAERSGLQGCFLYFVDRAAFVADNQQTPHRQHVEHVRTIANWLGIRTVLFPCIVFFRRPEFREYVCVPLHGQSASEIVSTVNGVFDSVEEKMKVHPELTPFRALQDYDQAVRGQARAQGAIHLLIEIATRRGVEIVQSLATQQ